MLRHQNAVLLRHQNPVLRRHAGRVRYEPGDPVWLAALARRIRRRRWAGVFPVTPRRCWPGKATGTRVLRPAVQARRVLRTAVQAPRERDRRAPRRHPARELDRVLILGEGHLSAVRAEYQVHYNTARHQRIAPMANTTVATSPLPTPGGGRQRRRAGRRGSSDR